MRVRARGASCVALSVALGAAGCESCAADRGRANQRMEAAAEASGADGAAAAVAAQTATTFVDGSVDASVDADDGAAELEGTATWIQVALVARLAPEIEAASLHRLRDGAALIQKSARAWSVSTIGRGKALSNVTAGLPMAPIHVRAGPDGALDEPLAVWGSVDEVWMSPAFGDSVHASRRGRPERLAKQYRFIVPFPDDSVLGVPASQPLAYATDDVPTRFAPLRGGGGALPSLGRDIRLWSLVPLGEGRVCGVGLEQTEAGGSSLRGWTWSPPAMGGERFFDLGEVADQPRLLPGRSGGCLVLHDAHGRAVDELNGSDGVVRKLGHVPGDPRYSTADVTNTGDALWTTAVVPPRLYRTDLTKHPLTYREYRLPVGFAGCDLRQIDAIAAVGDDDLWLLASCEHQGRWALLHTEPPRPEASDGPGGRRE